MKPGIAQNVEEEEIQGITVADAPILPLGLNHPLSLPRQIPQHMFHILILLWSHRKNLVGFQNDTH